MPRKFSFPSIKAYEGTSDPDDHVAQYRQRMLVVALPKESREATMCKGFSSTLTGPAMQWYINLPSRSIASFAILSDKFVEQFASSRCLGSLYIVFLRRALVGWSRLNYSIFGNMEGSPFRKFSFSRRKGAVPGTRPGILRSGEPGCLLAVTRRPVSFLGCGGILYLSIFSQQFVPYCLISSSNSGNNLCTQVIRSCSFSAGFLRQDISPVILLSRVPLRPEPHSEPGGGPIPLYQIGVWRFFFLNRYFLSKMGELWASDGVLEMVGPGALVIYKEELMDL
ncbi:hypothetical protein F2Q68_00038658 [Brassica cretica]|uniref:Retrotransposon gag domain-containing protein n=1 Tax=Brassica cretica TaxID=69181 RepID=A0A8S9MLI4_BRACR|nr:hypothetical protein F2Q68_00038658 [Brassica cretica]